MERTVAIKKLEKLLGKKLGWRINAKAPTPEFKHNWEDCPMCGRMVVCGKCGNNSCNAGYGTLPDGTTCDLCPSAYELQDKGENN